ncbi:hypothetical protein SELMODRAFT_403261 [Selaginella moellendorffii]|uniref:Uncharacterized protein n=1 Tax=Selaginella moellendorffii TaxID=88036 RepID=D8QTL3_SELML|nr:hypothetical protein SELMODRAFT_403261 [Selaginella moellendorffii]
MASERQGGWVMIRQNATEQELEQLETCLGNLYEDLDSKVIYATSVILKLAQKIECLAALATHRSALVAFDYCPGCALSRILREDGQKSFMLRINIISVFFIFSFFKDFHQNVGRATLQALSSEIQIILSQLIPDTKNEIRRLDQERLLYMSLRLLLNLAHSIHIEEKMKKFFLVNILSVPSINIYRAIIFLRKLSIFKENKDIMRKIGVIPIVSHLLPSGNELLVHPVLGLLRNLSFDPLLRSQMIKCNLIQTVGALINQLKFEHASCSFLYCISMDVSLRSAFAETVVVPNLLKIILSEPMRDVPEEVMALFVNLTTVVPNAEVIRNVSLLEESKSFLLCFVPDLVKFFVQGQPSIQVEVLGALNNMVWFEETTDELVQRDLLLAFARNIQSTNNEILQEICMFLGAVSSNRTAHMISEAGLAVKMCSVFLEKAKGDCLINQYMVVQFLFMLSRFLLFEPTRKDILTVSDRIAGYVFSLTRDSNIAVAKFADTLFNILMEVDHDNYMHLKYMRFKAFNNIEYLD